MCPRLFRCACAALVAVACSIATSVRATAATYETPHTIPSNCSVDVTSSLMGWIASVPNNSTLVFVSGGCYRIEGTLELFHRRGLDFEGNGATFRSFDPPTNRRAIWRIFNSTGIVFDDMTIEGSYANGGTYDPSLQHAPAIDLFGTTVHVVGVHMLNLGGDCIEFGPGGTRKRPTRSSGSVQYSTCIGTSRNAISVTGGNNILVERLTTSAIGYDVFDVEPDVGRGFGSRNVTFDNNTIGSYYLSAYSIVENRPISHQSFTNNAVVGRGLKITIGHLSSRWYQVRDVTITGNRDLIPEAPAAMDLSGIRGLTVTGNTIALTRGLLAQVDTSCGVNVSGNAIPGGSLQVSRQAFVCPAPTSR